MISRFSIAVAAVFLLLGGAAALAAERPNILWLTSEDHGPHMGCYGDKNARTPNVDALAARGMLFKKAWSVAPVCAPARTAIITGLYTSSSGGQHMRSMVSLPDQIKLYPQFLREAGYYCTNNSKEDYNVRKPAELWNESSNKAHWQKRDKDQPFFAVFNSTKSHESQIRTRPHKQIAKSEEMRVPAYHPDTPEVREDWAQYYDKVSEADADAGKRLKELNEAGLADDTIVFYYADHGSGMPRGKRWAGNSGLHVPLVVFFPPKWKHLAPREYEVGGKSDRLVSFVDLAPTVLSIAGIKPPAWMQGHPFAGSRQAELQPYLYGERGRMDERMDLVRSVTDGRYVYLRNYYPHVSQAQHVAYQFETPTTRVWWDLFNRGKASEAQSIFWRTPKSPEELYDLQNDPDEVKNLAKSVEHREVLEKLRKAQRDHLIQIRDVCLLPEGELHTRAEKDTPYDLARDESRYPLARILSSAELASNLDPAATPELTKLLGDSDSAVRWWAALGLLMRGQEAAAKAKTALVTALGDDSPHVRIAAAQALVQHGEQAAKASSLKVLAELAPPKANGVLVSMAALSAIEALGDNAQSLHAALREMMLGGRSPDPRYGGYVPRLIKNIVGESKPAGKAAGEKPAKNSSGSSTAKATASRPNVLLIFADDMGYSDAGCYGGEIETPHLDRLAAGGLRFTQFYNTARCWPSRAALLSGYYAQQVHRDGLPQVGGGSQGVRQPWAKLLPELLAPADYRSYHSGKWHIDGPVLKSGFLRSFDMRNQGNYFSIAGCMLDDHGIKRPQDEQGYYSTIATADYAIDFLKQHAASHPEQPFFQYLAFIAPHFPLHALPEDIAKYRDKYLTGWDAAREARFARQQKLGITRTQLSAIERDVGPPYAQPGVLDKLGPGEVLRPLPWEELTDEQRRFQATKMAIHAAMVDHMDQEIGRVIDQLKAMNAYENTLILFASDNGASAEIMVRDGGHDPKAEPGSAATYLCLGPGFSSVANTPHRRHKTWVHEGGIATSLIVHWPRGISAKNELRHTPSHVIDIVPTVLELAGVEKPEEFDGEPVPEAPGKSLVPAFKADETIARESLWWLHEGNRALRLGDWKLVAARGQPWELYDLSTDRAEQHNLAAKMPDKVQQLAETWQRQTDSYVELAKKTVDFQPQRKPGPRAGAKGKNK